MLTVPFFYFAMTWIRPWVPLHAAIHRLFFSLSDVYNSEIQF